MESEEVRIALEKIKSILTLHWRTLVAIEDAARFAIKNGTPDNNVHLACLVNIVNYASDAIKESLKPIAIVPVELLENPGETHETCFNRLQTTGVGTQPHRSRPALFSGNTGGTVQAVNCPERQRW